MALSAREVVGHMAEMEAVAGRILTAYEALLAEVESARARIAAQEGEARLDLASAYLPGLTLSAIGKLEKLTGFRGLSRRDPLVAMEREAKVLQSTIARIRADERYVRRVYLVGPEGEITRALAEARDMLGPWQEAVDRFEKLDGFLDLVAVGYDTPQFTESFWQPSYWKHWAAGDRICKELGLDDFGDDVLPAWRQALRDRLPWLEEVRRIEARAQEVHDLVQEHDQAVARLPRLPAIYLEQSQALLAEFLSSADFALLDEWVRKSDDDDRAVRMGLRRMAGLSAKLDVLDELRGGVGPVMKQLEGRMAKYRRKQVKYARPKYGGVSFPDDVVDRSFEAKAPKLGQQPEKLARVVGRIERYDDYARFDLDQAPELWFTEFTGGRPSQHFPRHRQWYERQSEVTVVHDRWDEARVVAAAAAVRSLDETGYLS